MENNMTVAVFWRCHGLPRIWDRNILRSKTFVVLRSPRTIFGKTALMLIATTPLGRSQQRFFIRSATNNEPTIFN